MSVFLYILFFLFILHMPNILRVKTPKDDGVYIPTTTKSILTDKEFTEKYLGTFSNSTFTCIYYDKVWNEMNRIGNAGYDANVIEYTIYKYEEHLKLIIKDANNSTSNSYPKFDDYRKKVISALNDKDTDTKLTIKNGSITYSNKDLFTIVPYMNLEPSVKKLVIDIKTMSELLNNTISNSMSEQTIVLIKLYKNYEDTDSRTEIARQLELISNFLKEQVELNELPGSKKYVNNKLGISSQYIQSVIDNNNWVE